MGSSHVCNRNVIYRKTVFMVSSSSSICNAHIQLPCNHVGWKNQIRNPNHVGVGGIALFFSAGAGGVVNSAMPLDLSSRLYWVVGHFHLFVRGTILFGFGFIYYFFPYVTGRMYNETMGKIHFILSFVGTVLVFFTQHILGLFGMPRRIYDYPASRNGTNEHHYFNWRIHHRYLYGNIPWKPNLEFQRKTSRYGRSIRLRRKILLPISGQPIIWS